jgi:Ca2+/H+ antiporter
MDLSLAIAIGSSIPIALFAAPDLVLASYFIAPQSHV